MQADVSHPNRPKHQGRRTVELAYHQPLAMAQFGGATTFRRPEPIPPRGEILRRRRVDLIRDYVDQNLANPDLDAPGTARTLGMSVRSLHLALADSGESFGQLLQRRRLETCCALLSRPDAGTSVADIAFGCGFQQPFQLLPGLPPPAWRLPPRSAQCRRLPRPGPRRLNRPAVAPRSGKARALPWTRWGQLAPDPISAARLPLGFRAKPVNVIDFSGFAVSADDS